jgi:hypothetical protein
VPEVASVVMHWAVRGLVLAVRSNDPSAPWSINGNTHAK